MLVILRWIVRSLYTIVRAISLMVWPSLNACSSASDAGSISDDGSVGSGASLTSSKTERITGLGSRRSPWSAARATETRWLVGVFSQITPLAPASRAPRNAGMLRSGTMAIVEVPGVALASAIAAKAAGLAQNTITIVASSCAVRTWIESF